MHIYIHLVSVGLLGPTPIILILLLYHQGTHTSTYTNMQYTGSSLDPNVNVWNTTSEYCNAVLRPQLYQVPNYQCITVLQLERSTEEKHPVHTWGRLT